ncbi:DUF262 domain-containing protein [Aquimarina sp. AD1]|uniref:DUF262 domain-containing protein n=1 Tax=Aquimarina sp. (strain AD1) TaxID=1714848 RepID=UPI000E4E770C|nr:DUF262 domain-containing protein [Aquimarina sp. AD1]AXT56437.1 DUF262 domain-containing protein [Aquimarina sp. AD1]RKN12980.1 DUF262 domain-containing protein [Aquimarina sp. AD1]
MNKDESLLKKLENTKNSLSTDRLDMSFGEIMSMYERNEIIIDPIFQRLFRWTNFQQTRFIESLLLGIPIPPIFVAEDKDGRWELVDGLQRISTVFSFFGLLKKLPEKNSWILKNGDLIPELDNYSCKDLPLKLQLNIKRSVCRIEIVKWNSKYDMRYELFNRLNTGGARLTDQEIRNCIFRGVSSEFNTFLSSESKKPVFIDLIGPTEKQIEELYLDELVLRFCSLYNNGENVKETISEHMTSFMKTIVSQPQKIELFKDIFNRTINLLKPLGKEVFRGSNNVLSTSLYDGITIGIAQNISKFEIRDTNYLLSKIDQLKNDLEFRKASGSGAHSKSRIYKRLKVANLLFENE